MGQILIQNTFTDCETIQGLMWTGVNWLFPKVYVKNRVNIYLNAEALDSEEYF